MNKKNGNNVTDWLLPYNGLDRRDRIEKRLDSVGKVEELVGRARRAAGARIEKIYKKKLIILLKKEK